MKRIIKKIFSLLRKYILSGILVVVPIYLTIAIVRWVLDAIDRNVLPFIPADYGGNIHGLGIFILIVVLLVVGFFTANRWGEWLVGGLNNLLERLPLLGELYGNINHIFKNFAGNDNSKSFSAAVLVEYPAPGIWTMGFVTGKIGPELEKKLGRGFVTIFVPFMPVPTSGVTFIVKEKKVIKLDMKVQDALAYMLSLGVAQKETDKKTIGLDPFHKNHYKIDKKMVKKLRNKG